MLVGTYDRIAQTLLKGQPKAKRTASLYNGKFLTGTKSLHRTPQSRKWRLFWRLKSQRITALDYYWSSKP